jgi:hypothetical protein
VADSSDDAAVDPVISAYVEAAAGLLGLRLGAEGRREVARHFTRLAALSRLVEAHALDLTDEPASIVPPGPRP